MRDVSKIDLVIAQAKLKYYEKKLIKYEELNKRELPLLDNIEKQIHYKNKVKVLKREIVELSHPERYSFIYCPKCDSELISNGTHIPTSPDGEQLFRCNNCKTTSKWNFDIAPVPILVDENFNINKDMEDKVDEMKDKLINK